MLFQYGDTRHFEWFEERVNLLLSLHPVGGRAANRGLLALSLVCLALIRIPFDSWGCEYAWARWLLLVRIIKSLFDRQISDILYIIRWFCLFLVNLLHIFFLNVLFRTSLILNILTIRRDLFIRIYSHRSVWEFNKLIEIASPETLFSASIFFTHSEHLLGRLLCNDWLDLSIQVLWIIFRL